MPKHSAGLLMYRLRSDVDLAGLEVLLVHPGGPFWAKKNLGAWSIPKGEFQPGELPFDAARREFHEETGFPVQGPFLELGSIKQTGGKTVTAWAFAGDCDPAALTTTTFCSLAWPPRSGRTIQFPEVDRCAWFPLPEAHTRILKSQTPFLNTLSDILTKTLVQPTPTPRSS